MASMFAAVRPWHNRNMIMRAEQLVPGNMYVFHFCNHYEKGTVELVDTGICQQDSLVFTVEEHIVEEKLLKVSHEDGVSMISYVDLGLLPTPVGWLHYAHVVPK
jgi:hypothetical protein